MVEMVRLFEPFPVLETPRFVLRKFQEADIEAVFRIKGDPAVMRYSGQPPMQTREEAAERVHGILNDLQTEAGIRWAITRRDDGEFLGSGGFWRLIKRHFRAEIGYELAPEVWGQGIMAEALRPIISFGFTHMGLHTIEANIDPDNHGSRRVLEKLGFAQEGYFTESYYIPHEERFSDTAVFSLLKTQWR